MLALCRWCVGPVVRFHVGHVFLFRVAVVMFLHVLVFVLECVGNILFWGGRVGRGVRWIVLGAGIVGGYVGDALIVWECVGVALAMFWWGALVMVWECVGYVLVKIES